MNLFCKIFVSGREFETQDAAIDLMRSFGSRLASLLKSNALAGYRVVAITELDDFEEEDIDREIVESITIGRLPAIYINLTYDLDEHSPDDRELGLILSESGMVLALSYPNQGD
ncbi:hypothetical protein OG298_20445 [Streptomyces sp. NBC_01005]|uniref:hypothetical protein n=1 Tax=unclassified Streptomyces TaxID=2593676 RepID=UPI00386A5CB6|nr:hypothetical protein OG298_20445 [Streptomyces sp. NBC_01005]WTC96059.1 hypothetical protein OH736_20460 [Streptomyces sp. NBC_01650]